MTSIDLTPNIGPARDQGKRPTCLSFAMSDTHQIARQHPDFLSPECLHTRTAAKLGKPADQAVNVIAMSAVMSSLGQLEENSWPYGGYEGPGTSHKANVTPVNFDSSVVEQTLKNGIAIGVALGIGVEFYTPSPAGLTASMHTQAVANHAVVIVGMTATPKKMFLVRNSWGPAWAQNGHAWCDESYLSLTAKYLIFVRATP